MATAIQTKIPVMNVPELNKHAWSAARLVLLALSAISTAMAQPALGSSDGTFFDAPAATPLGEHGDLITYRPTALSLGADAPATLAWHVTYLSTDAEDVGNLVSGTALVPKAAWTGAGPRPIILYAVGTQGMGKQCAPSRQMVTGYEYEIANIVLALRAGYGVLVTDYDGYLNGGRLPTYMVGLSQGRAVLDIFKAATQIPGAGIDPQSKVAIWGYSQGGQSASFAAEIAQQYTPGLSVVGVASGGIPANLTEAARVLDGSHGFAFLASATLGLYHQYGDSGKLSMPINYLQNDLGKAAFEQLKTECIFTSLFREMNHNMSSYVQNNVDLESLMLATKRTLAAQSAGTRPVPYPQYLYHGLGDEFIPLQPSLDLKKAYCAMGGTVAYDLYPSEHLNTLFQAAPTVLAWIGDRMAGKPAPSTCDNTAPPPATTAIARGGNLVVPMLGWRLQGKLRLKALNQDVALPVGATMSTQADVSAKVLSGTSSIPPFTQQLKILGIRSMVGIRMTPASDITGTVQIDDNGQLHIKGVAPMNISVTSLGATKLGNCRTTTPVNFPLVYDGPVSAVGAGTLKFAGTVTLPKLSGCGTAAILSTLMAGKGQSFSFSTAPPPAVPY
jgi:Secretory lipase